MTSGISYFPIIVPANSVVGRLSSTAGITEAIPFAQLAVALGVGGSTYLLATNIAGTNTITGTTATAPLLAANQVVFLIPVNTNTGATTFDRDAQATPKSIFCNGAALVGGEIQAGNPIILFYDGTRYNLLQEQAISDGQPLVVNSADATKKVKLSASSLTTANTRTITAPDYDFPLQRDQAPIASGRNIAARTNNTTPNTKLDITADEVIVENASGVARRLSTVSGTIDFGTVGANGLDTGTQSASTWYYGWVICKDDGTVAVLGSLSTSAPTMPSGYTYKALITAARSDGSTHFIKYRQFGNRVSLEGALNLLSPNLTSTPTSETAKDISTNIPPIASHFTMSVYCANGASTGGGAVNSYISIRVVTTVELYKIPFGAPASSPLNFFGLVSRLPNLGQNFYYLISATTNISSGALVVDLISFELPGGGQ